MAQENSPNGQGIDSSDRHPEGGELKDSEHAECWRGKSGKLTDDQLLQEILPGDSTLSSPERKGWKKRFAVRKVAGYGV